MIGARANVGSVSAGYGDGSTPTSPSGTVQAVLFAGQVLSNPGSGALSLIDVLDGFIAPSLPYHFGFFAIVVMKNARGGFSARLRLRRHGENEPPIETTPISVPLIATPNLNLAIQIPPFRVSVAQDLTVDFLVEGNVAYSENLKVLTSPIEASIRVTGTVPGIR